jgi:hypothetical protein
MPTLLTVTAEELPALLAGGTLREAHNRLISATASALGFQMVMISVHDVHWMPGSCGHVWGSIP